MKTRPSQAAFCILGALPRAGGLAGVAAIERFRLLLLLGASLFLDGVSGPLQERLRASTPSVWAQMFFSDAWAAGFVALAGAATGQLAGPGAYLGAHPRVAAWVAVLALASAGGHAAIFYTMRLFDSLTVSVITTTRKVRWGGR